MLQIENSERTQEHSLLNENHTKIMGIGTATTEHAYTQKEVVKMMNITDRKIRSVYLNSGIDKRYLTLPTHEELQSLGNNGETQGALLHKHKDKAIEIGVEAIMDCLDQSKRTVEDIECFCCVTSTGMLVPSLSALISKRLSLVSNCYRWDIVGMGCSAGLNGLGVAFNWSAINTNKLAVVLCVEICSAAYVNDGSIETAVVNSLFGDGASAVAVQSCDSDNINYGTPRILHFSSHLLSQAIDAMKFNWDELLGKYSFYLSREVPYVVGSQVEIAISQLLCKEGICQSDIKHWVVHSGGKKVIDSICLNLGLSKYELRHTKSVLKDFGNLSSGSFLISLKRLVQESIVEPGDYGVLMTMGPGASIETALVRW